MNPLPTDDPRRLAFARLAQGLPEAEVSPFGRRHLRLTVRGKSFAYLTDNHHADGRVALWCKAAPGEGELLASADAARFFIPPYVGKQGWLGLRLDLGPVDWTEVGSFVTDAYRLLAPRRLVQRLDGAGKL